jgi:hypothetical protein
VLLVYKVTGKVDPLFDENKKKERSEKEDECK